MLVNTTKLFNPVICMWFVVGVIVGVVGVVVVVVFFVVFLVFFILNK